MSSRKRNSEIQRKAANREMIKNAFDIPQVLSHDLPHIEAEGNREVSVDGCKGILEYTQDTVKINTGRLVISFIGDDMEIKVYSEIQTVISGNILSIEFENQG